MYDCNHSLSEINPSTTAWCMLSIMALLRRTYATWQHQSMKSEEGLICGRIHSDISTFREPEQGSDQGLSRLLVPQHGTVFLQTSDHWHRLTVSNVNWRLTYSDSCIISLYCNLIVVCFIDLVIFLNVFFSIFRRPWPNFVCKGRRTSSVVLVLVLVLLLVLEAPLVHWPT